MVKRGVNQTSSQATNVHRGTQKFNHTTGQSPKQIVLVWHGHAYNNFNLIFVQI